jgi:hypothetical protein
VIFMVVVDLMLVVTMNLVLEGFTAQCFSRGRW